MSRGIRDSREWTPDARVEMELPPDDLWRGRADGHGRHPDHQPWPGSGARSWSPADRLTLPRSPSSHAVSLDRQTPRLRDSQVHLLSTVGAFRALLVRDIEEIGERTHGDSARTRADLRSLRGQGLLRTHQVVIDRRAERVAVLTKDGRSLLERASRRRHAGDRPDQRFHAGLGALRDLEHDVRLYRMFDTERGRLEAERATIHRVVLDCELKAEYHAYVHERQRSGVDPAEARRAFARDRELPFEEGHIRFPDVRVEYESEDGRYGCRDLEFVTRHYSPSQVAGKHGAGFRVYRAAGPAGGARRGGGALG